MDKNQDGITAFTPETHQQLPSSIAEVRERFHHRYLVQIHLCRVCELLPSSTGFQNEVINNLLAMGHSHGAAPPMFTPLNSELSPALLLTMVNRAWQFGYVNPASIPKDIDLSSMGIVDVIEMVCDWMARSEVTGFDIFSAIDYYQQRYGFTDNHKAVFIALVNYILDTP